MRGLVQPLWLVPLLVAATAVDPSVVRAQDDVPVVQDTRRGRAGPGPEEGVMIQALLASGFSVIGGGGGFAGVPLPSLAIRAGYRLGNLTIAASLGLLRVRFGDEDDDVEDITAITGFVIAPTLFFEFWESADDRVKIGMLASIGLGWYRQTFEDKVEGETVDKTESDGFLIPFALGLFADYFAHPNFAVGLELGFQGAPAVGGKTEEGDGEETTNQADDFFGSYGLFGALRLTAVFD